MEPDQTPEMPASVPDLALVSDQELKEELMRRCDHGLILMRRVNEEGPGRDGHYRQWRGDVFVLIGMATEATQLLGALFRSTQRPSPG